MIKLPGMIARHPGAALATLGFYKFFAKSPKIHWESMLMENSTKPMPGDRYYPVIDTGEVRDVRELAKLLCNRDRWKELFWKKDPSTKSSSKHISVERYKEIADTEWSVLATDQKVNKEDTSCTPFCMYIRNMSWRIIDGWIEALEVNQVERVLIDSPWRADDYSNGSQRNGLFYEVCPQEVNADYLIWNNRIIPVVCLLACLSYKMFPCFVYDKVVTALGWYKAKSFYYPIFSKPVDWRSYVSWVVNRNILLKMPLEAKQSIGLIAVYRSDRLGYSMGGQVEYVLWEGKVVK